MNSSGSDKGDPALRKLFGVVFDSLVDESFGGPEAARRADACAKLVDTLLPGIVKVTELEHPRAEIAYMKTCSEEEFWRYYYGPTLEEQHRID
jgi:hypothetical protein